MLTREHWAGRIPHAQAMALIARVHAWDAQSIDAGADAPGSAHPLLREGRLHAVHACEYGAQAAAVHGALLAQAQRPQASPAGLLAALRDVRLSAPWLDPALPLRIRAWRLAALPAAVQYRFEVLQAGAPCVQGQVLIAFAESPS